MGLYIVITVVGVMLGLGVGWLLWGRDRYCAHTRLLQIKGAPEGTSLPFECVQCGQRVKRPIRADGSPADGVPVQDATMLRVVDRTNRHVHRFEWLEVEPGVRGWACQCGEMQNEQGPAGLQPA